MNVKDMDDRTLKINEVGYEAIVPASSPRSRYPVQSQALTEGFSSGIFSVGKAL